jgi:hypothetical protein
MGNDSVIQTKDGVVADDPLRGAPVGATLRISSDLFAIATQSGLNSIANWDFFNGVLVAIHFADPKSQQILGSGVLVAPGVVVAARHVIEAKQSLLMAGELQIICTGIAPDGLMIWRCHQITLVGSTDVAFLMVRCASKLPNVLRQATFTTRTPRIGERIAIAGIRHQAFEPVAIHRTLELSVMAAQGVIVSRHENGRDRVMLPFPCLEVDCEALGGMSGGPAFDQDGFLIGLITSSFEGQVGPTFVSLLWPALATRIKPCWPDNLYKEPVSLLEMDRRLCSIHQPEALQVSPSLDGDRLTYTRWE